MLSGLCFLLIGLRPALWPVAVGAFGAHLTIAIIYGSNQAIWQSKVPPDVQGKVFAAQQMIAASTRPLAHLVAGPLVDRLFEPLLAPGSGLARSVGQIISLFSLHQHLSLPRRSLMGRTGLVGDLQPGLS